MTTLEATKGVVRRGLFPGSMPAWGTERVQLVPQSNPTNGRSNFFIHGGLTPGSAGCIDLVQMKGLISMRSALRGNRLTKRLFGMIQVSKRLRIPWQDVATGMA